MKAAAPDEVMVVDGAEPETAVWEAPGPGLWRRDDTHQNAPTSNYFWHVFDANFNEGIRSASKRYGLLLDRFDNRNVRGWIYSRLRPVGAPEKPGGLPPRFVFKLMFRVHPELRRRRRAARRAVAERLWRRDAERWQDEVRDRFRARLKSLQSVDPTRLDDPSLRQHVDDVSRALSAGFEAHFSNMMAHWVGVGDWATKTCAWTGIDPAAALSLLAGASTASVDPVGYVDAIAAAVRGTPGAVQLLRDGQISPEERLQRLRGSSPEIARALDAYLEEHGHRIVTGFDLLDKTTLELPQTVLETISARLETPERAPLAGSEQRVDRVRERVPAEKQAAFDELFEDARLLYGLRDDDVGPSFEWPMGLLRRALTAAGARMKERGLVVDVGDVFEATPAEVQGLLGGPGPRPSSEELARRADQRRRWTGVFPPLELGEDEGPAPPSEWMPPEVARINDALMFSSTLEEWDLRPRVESTAVELGGHPASPGRYEGTARVVLDPSDLDRLRQGDVLVARLTTPAYNVVLPLLGAIVTDSGGVLSHPAIVAREFGIPAVVGTTEATKRIADGATVVVDGDRGVVLIGS